MKTKSTAVKATLVVASAVTAATSLPINMVMQVYAEEGTNIETSQMQNSNIPSVKKRLQESVNALNETVVASSTVLQGATTNYNESKMKYENAGKKYNETDKKKNSVQKIVDDTVTKELTDRLNAVEAAQAEKDRLKAEKESIEAQIKEKETAIAEMEAKVQETKAALDACKAENINTEENLANAEAEKATLESEISTLQGQINTLSSELAEANRLLTDVTATLEQQKKELTILTARLADLKSSLQTKQAELAGYKESLEANYTEEQIAALKNEVDTLASEVTTLETQISNAQTELDNLTNTMNQQQRIYESAKASYNEAVQKLSDATAAHETAKETYNTAKKTYDAYKKQLDDLEKGIEPAELTKLKEEYTDAVKVYRVYYNNYLAAQANYDAKIEALEKSVEANTNSIERFFEFVSEQVCSDGQKLDMKLAQEVLDTYRDKDINIGGKTIKAYDTKNIDGSVFSIQQFRESLNFIKTGNAIRAYEDELFKKVCEDEGRDEAYYEQFKIKQLDVSFYLMAVAAVQNNYSSLLNYHSEKYNISENLYMTDYDTDSKTFHKEDGTVDVEKLDSIGRGTIDGTDLEFKNPYFAWWIAEKTQFEEGNNNKQDIGHYLNIINCGKSITGFATSGSIQNGDYKNVYNQLYAANTNYSGYNDKNQKFYLEGRSVEEVESLLNDWVIERARLIAAAPTQEEINLAEAEANTAYEIRIKQGNIVDEFSSKVNNYETNLRTNVTNSEKAKNDALTDLNNKKQAIDSAEQELTMKTNDMNSQKAMLEGTKETVANRTSNLTVLKNSLTDKQQKLAAATTKYNNATTEKTELERLVTEATITINQLNLDITTDTNSKTMLETSIGTNENLKVQYTNTITTKTNDKNLKEGIEENKAVELDAVKQAIKEYNAALIKLRNKQTEYDNADKTLKDLKAKATELANELASVTAELETAAEDLENKQELLEIVRDADTTWKDIKEVERLRGVFGSFNDPVLDNLADKVNEYKQLKAELIQLKQEYDTAKTIYSAKEESYQIALANYQTALAQYNRVKAELEAFEERYGTVSESTITVKDAEYTGKEVTPEIVVKDSKGNTVDKEEYTVTYQNNIQLGTGSVTVKMSGENYVGEFTKKFQIVEKAIEQPEHSGQNGQNNQNDKTDSNTNKNGVENTVKTGDDEMIATYGLAAMLSGLALIMSGKKRKEEN